MGVLDGKVALVTGGASGISRAIAAAYREAGAQVWLADISRDAVVAAAGEIGAGARGVFLDVTDAASIAQVSAEVAASGIDVLVNGAGVYGRSLEPWQEVTEAGFDFIFSVNTRGLLFVTQAVAAHMISQGRGGAIINIASAGGRRGDPISVAYSASKAAAISLTQSAALAFAAHGIRVNAIAPGIVSTPMGDTVLELRSARLGKTPEELDRARVKNVPLGRNALPSEMAGAAVFLASAESSYVTGQTLNVDGGVYLN